ncbi:MAG: DNA-deoxyinosine glycosylase [Pseudomonadota bacterium]
MGEDISEALKIGLPMVAPADARLFILGSLPGDASLSASRYYAHPTNQFWRLLGGAIGEDLQRLDYDARLAALSRRRIGLWDVIGAARRRGSLDQAIRDAEHNQIDRLIADFPQLRAIAFNGATAAATGRRLLTDRSSAIAIIGLPSSSAAHTAPFALKAERWALVRDYCAD